MLTAALPPQIDLDVKKGVKPDQVRAINVVTRVETVQVVEKKAEKKLREMKDKLKKAKSAAKSAGSDAEKRQLELEAAKAQAALSRLRARRRWRRRRRRPRRRGAAPRRSGWEADKRSSMSCTWSACCCV